MSTPADYSGRVVDVLVFQGGPGRTTGGLAAAGEGGRVCAGIVKLAQRWVIRFLQEKGSVPHAPATGTEFVASCRTGRLRTEADARAAFAQAERLVRAQTQALESAADPADERLDRANLQSLTLSAGRLTLRVEVVSLAGVARSVLVPIPL